MSKILSQKHYGFRRERNIAVLPDIVQLQEKAALLPDSIDLFCFEKFPAKGIIKENGLMMGVCRCVEIQIVGGLSSLCEYGRYNMQV